MTFSISPDFFTNNIDNILQNIMSKTLVKARARANMKLNQLVLPLIVSPHTEYHGLKILAPGKAKGARQ